MNPNKNKKIMIPKIKNRKTPDIRKDIDYNHYATGWVRSASTRMEKLSTSRSRVSDEMMIFTKSNI